MVHAAEQAARDRLFRQEWAANELAKIKVMCDNLGLRLEIVDELLKKENENGREA